MKPILFPADATSFETLGAGVLSEATSCIVTEERNGIFELEMVYPQSGRLFSSLTNRSILYASVDASGRKEPFRIYKITKPRSGQTTIYAAHLSYDLSGIVVSPFAVSNVNDAMQAISDYSTTNNPFTFWTDKTTAAQMQVDVPSTIRSIMGGSSGSLLDAYGGEFSYETYMVKLHANRGTNRGVTIRYGKNLVDLKQEENIQNAYTGVYPYWLSEEAYAELPEKIVTADGDYGFTKIRPLDASSAFETKPTEAQLRNYAVSFMEANSIGVPKVSISVFFVPLEQSEEYKNLAPLQQVLLCDTVSVKFEKLGVDATAKCVKTVFDVLKNRYAKIELGEAKTNIADTIVSQGQEIKKGLDTSGLQTLVGSATQLITGNKGGYVVLHSSTGEAWPDEILVMDTPSPETANQVWRWNKAGLGYSSTGYSGEYKLAMTMDGKFVADFISTGTLDAKDLTVKNFWTDNLRSSGESVLGAEEELWISNSILRMSSAGVLRLAVQLAEDGSPGIYFSDSGGALVAKLTTSGITIPSITPSSNADFAWKYISSIRETVLVQV